MDSHAANSLWILERIMKWKDVCFDDIIFDAFDRWMLK